MKKFIYLITLLVLFSCIEPIEIESIDFQDMLVVEGVITNEFKYQEIRLSRTYNIENDSIVLENNASVWVEGSDGSNYSFSQNNEGVYISNLEFEAVPNIEYQLFITTNSGDEYNSSPVKLSPLSEITELYADLALLDTGETGIQVYVDSDNQNNDAQYFRYEYEETYKIIAPSHTYFDLILSNRIDHADGASTYDRTVVLREEEERTCFSSRKSSGIILTTTSDFESNLVSRFPVRSISADDPIIRERYSILVKQYVQNAASYTFYKAVNDLGSLQNFLAQLQPGFVSGNIQKNNELGQTIGYFDVSSVSEKRIYFDFNDFDLQLPPYLFSCNTWLLDYNDNTAQDEDPDEREFLYQLVTNHNYKYLTGQTGGTLFEVVNPECGDCTSISSNIEPNFWED